MLGGGKPMLTMLTTTLILWFVLLAFLARSFLFGMGRLNIFNLFFGNRSRRDDFQSFWQLKA